MRNLLELISKHNHLLLFILLEIFALFLIIQNSQFHKAAFINSTNSVTANSFAILSNFKDYFSLKKTNDLLLLENAKLKSLIEIKHTIDDISKLKLSKPTLFISGIEDYLFVRQIEEYVKDKSNCFLEKVNNSGHIVNIDQYQTFNKFALRFLK